MLKNMLTLSHVPRWAIIDTTKKQTVADHSFRVVAICIDLMKELRAINVTVDGEALLHMAVTHDVEEAMSGDIPTPYKKMLAAYGFDAGCDPSFEYYLVKVADIIEALTFLKRYGVRPSRVMGELHDALNAAKQAAWEAIEAPEVVQHSWWNRIVDKILDTGANYE